MKTLLVSALIVCTFGACLSAECHGAPDPNAKPNNNPIFSSPPTFVTSVQNGKLYRAGDDEDVFDIVHVWGTPYEMGYAQGQLQKEKANKFITSLWAYLEAQVIEAINGTVSWIPVGVAKWVADVGLDVALDLTYDATKKYSGSYFEEEMKGICDASGADYKTLRRIHMIGELTKGSCSMMGAWGTATEDGTPLLAFRALDWNTDGPFKDFPQVTVYHPTPGSGNGHAFMNVGWVGWIGSITGMSSMDMAICEIGVSFPDDTFGQESRLGIPFTYILRDILQFDVTIDDSISRIVNADRTCDLILGVGDGKLNEFRSVQYSHSVARFFDDKNLLPLNETWHPRIPDTVYHGMDWLCPGYSVVLANQIKEHHGGINADIAIHNILPVVQTGDLHIAVYDFANDAIFIANARKDAASGPLNAYDRTFTKLSVSALFGEENQP
uniref:Acid ceramidase-like protein n=2 Tax=Palpitomonas bilix TaxID=652834 RepID=A0A7S3G4I9_9EUKA